MWETINTYQILHRSDLILRIFVDVRATAPARLQTIPEWRTGESNRRDSRVIYRHMSGSRLIVQVLFLSSVCPAGLQGSVSLRVWIPA